MSEIAQRLNENRHFKIIPTFDFRNLCFCPVSEKVNKMMPGSQLSLCWPGLWGRIRPQEMMRCQPGCGSAVDVRSVLPESTHLGTGLHISVSDRRSLQVQETRTKREGTGCCDRLVRNEPESSFSQGKIVLLVRSFFIPATLCSPPRPLWGYMIRPHGHLRDSYHGFDRQ